MKPRTDVRLRTWTDGLAWALLTIVVGAGLIIACVLLTLGAPA